MLLFGSSPAPPPPPAGPTYAKLWPPSEESAPFLLAMCAVQISVLAFVFKSPKKQSAYLVAAKEEKRARYAEGLRLMASAEAAKDGKHDGKGGERTKELPEASRLLSLLHDNVDGLPVTHYGIPAADASHIACKALLDRAVRAQLTRAKTLCEASLQPAADLTEEWLEEHATSAKEVTSHLG